MFAVKRSTGVTPEENLMIFSDYKSMDRQLYIKDCIGGDEKSPQISFDHKPFEHNGHERQPQTVGNSLIYDKEKGLLNEMEIGQNHLHVR